METTTFFTLPQETTALSLHCHWRLLHFLYTVTGDYCTFFTLSLEITSLSLHCHWRLLHFLYTVTGTTTRVLLRLDTQSVSPTATKEQERYALLQQVSLLHCPLFIKVQTVFLLSSTTLFTQLMAVHDIHQLHVHSHFAVQLSRGITHSPSR